MTTPAAPTARPELLPHDEPFARFSAWYDEAQRCGMPEPTHVFLATCDQQGRPSARVVLLKAFDEQGFVFYTNLHSRKGRELADNPSAALCFYWGPLERQVRVCGEVEAVSEAEADAYFATRPRESQLGAWASLQSSPLAAREVLLERLAAERARFAEGPVQRPPHWSGFRVVPREMEFWQGMPSRLHERAHYLREGKHWRVGALFP